MTRLAEYYDAHDTGAEMETGDWVEPQPMATTSLRLPADVIEELKRQARVRHLRYTSYVRSILERAARGETPPEIADITERLERIERAVTERQSSGDQKTALRSDRSGQGGGGTAAMAGRRRGNAGVPAAGATPRHGQSALR